jgi:hypothetical protein
MASIGAQRAAGADGPRYLVDGDGGALPLEPVRRLVDGVDHSDTLVVVRTKASAASTVARALDEAHLDECLGTIAGDDTCSCAAPRPRGRSRRPPLRRAARPRLTRTAACAVGHAPCLGRSPTMRRMRSSRGGFVLWRAGRCGPSGGGTGSAGAAILLDQLDDEYAAAFCRSSSRAANRRRADGDYRRAAVTGRLPANLRPPGSRPRLRGDRGGRRERSRHRTTAPRRAAASMPWWGFPVPSGEETTRWNAPRLRLFLREPWRPGPAS